MNTKQKMIEAGCKAFLAAYDDPSAEPMDYRREVSAALDAALAVLENEKDFDEYSSFIEFIRNQEPKP